MSLDLATWTEIIPILRESSAIWSAGLSEDLYRHYTWRQLHHAWSRQNLRFMVYRDKGQVVTSCKLYNCKYLSRGAELRLVGVGAIFTPQRHRGNGYGRRLLEEIIDRAQAQEQAGVLLYSEIGEAWYTDMGFEPFSAIDFYIDLDQLRANGIRLQAKPSPQPEMIQSRHDREKLSGLETGLPPAILSDLSRHYMRWLGRQPFGFIRDENYLAFKFGREEFLVSHSSLNWPKKTFWMLDEGSDNGGYAITEQAGSNLRILEVIGTESARQVLWQSIFSYALNNEISRLRGWEGVIRDFAPAFSLKQIVDADDSLAANRSSMQIYSAERNWGLPLLLPLQEGISDWWNQFPCPFMELDYL